MSTYVMKLYVTGNTPRSKHATENLNRICREHLSAPYNIEVIDLLERPHIAEEEKIIATPMLIREFPPPKKKIIGDLSDIPQVLNVLEIEPDSSPRNRKKDRRNDNG